MPPKANPAKLNPLQLKTLTLLQAIARLPDASSATPEGDIAITAFPHAHGDHFHLGDAVVSSRDATGHAETNLVRAASTRYSLDELRTCTLYTTTEPCAMCAAAIYWAGIGAVTYALPEDALRAMTGDDERNPTLALPCREVFAAGSRPVAVHGPVALDAAREVHAGFWRHD